MRIYTTELIVPKRELELAGLSALRDYYFQKLRGMLPEFHRVVRFVVTKTDSRNMYCEADVLVAESAHEFDSYVKYSSNDTVFDFRKRNHENTEKFTAALLIPTGIGAEIGGHSGDGNPVARLLASACDRLITHPNVVNAADINEMTENTLYVEGSILTRLFMGRNGLQPVRSNRLLLLMDTHTSKELNDFVVNAVSSARVTLGVDCDVLEMHNPIEASSSRSASGRATGEVTGVERLFKLIQQYHSEYDAIALSTAITDKEDHSNEYFATNSDDVVNPWGGVEAMLTHSTAEIFNVPCAHAPFESTDAESFIRFGVVDPRKAPEMLSDTELHCVLKGLHHTPRIVGPLSGVTLEDISALVIPDGCIGLPTLAALENDIPVIAVRGNKNLMRNNLKALPFKKGKLFIVENYLEAAGVMVALRAGVSLEAVQRPIPYTRHIHETMPIASKRILATKNKKSTAGRSLAART